MHRAVLCVAYVHGWHPGRHAERNEAFPTVRRHCGGRQRTSLCNAAAFLHVVLLRVYVFLQRRFRSFGLLRLEKWVGIFGSLIGTEYLRYLFCIRRYVNAINNRL